MDNHGFRSCKQPIISFGIIMYKRIHGELKFLLIQRKDTTGYIDLLRGRYYSSHRKDKTLPREKYEYIRNFIEEITVDEKQKLLTLTFDELWDRLWVNHNSKMYINDKKKAKEKFQELDIKNILSEFEPKYTETEYGFPKGRRHDANEDGISCAKREMLEETGIHPSSYRIRYDIPSLNEKFVGSNGVQYLHIYYIAECPAELNAFVDSSNILQTGEVKSVDFYTLKECLKKFRPYDTNKKSVLIKAWNIISSRLGMNTDIRKELE